MNSGKRRDGSPGAFESSIGQGNYTGSPYKDQMYLEEEMKLDPNAGIENPLIQNEIHKEYLEDIPGLPARNANVVNKH